jgi:hypothetical protein
MLRKNKQKIEADLSDYSEFKMPQDCKFCGASSGGELTLFPVLTPWFIQIESSLYWQAIQKIDFMQGG